MKVTNFSHGVPRLVMEAMDKYMEELTDWGKNFKTEATFIGDIPYNEYLWTVDTFSLDEFGKPKDLFQAVNIVFNDIGEIVTEEQFA